MSNQTDIKLMKWPFLAGDAVLLAFAYFIYARHESGPMSGLEAALFVSAGAMGAALAVTPFLLEYFTAVKMVETGAVVSTIGQIQNLETIAGQITGATAQWQGAHEQANRSAAAAREIADRMSAETAAFTDFLKKAADTERTTLKLEIEKLRRAEGDWLGVVVRMLDHVYALNLAAQRSGQQPLIEQLSQFQNSCRDTARRIGLSPFIPAVNDPFDPKCHETPDSQAMSVADPRVRDIIATGYTYQGRMIRPALVSLQNPKLPARETTQAQEVSEPNGDAKKAAQPTEQSLL